MSHDLLVYCAELPDELPRRLQQVTSALGVEVCLASGLDLRHAGYLRASVEITPRAPLTRAAAHASRGKLAAGFDLFVERFEAPVGNGLEDVPPHLAARIRDAPFCVVVTLSHEDSPAAAIAAFFCAVGLASLTGGAIFEPEEGRHWDAELALEQADHYLEDVFGIAGCQAPDVPLSGRTGS